MNGILKAGIEVDRKVMADLAVREPAAFKALVDTGPGRPQVSSARRIEAARTKRSEEGAWTTGSLFSVWI